MQLHKAPWPEWKTVRLIGSGSFGTVYEIQRILVDGDVERAAMKVITIPHNPGDIEEMYAEGYDEESITATFRTHLKSVVSEYSLMRKLDTSANIVNCKDISYIRHADGIGWDIYIRMELLTPLLQSLSCDISEATVLKIARDLCNALALCKKHEIVHRDIKPQNIFISPAGDYKLGDFGIAKVAEKTAGGTRIGTYRYMAPEVFYNKPYGSAADIYSLGLVLYWLLNGRRMPFAPLPPAPLMASQEEEIRHRRLTGEPLPEPACGSAELKKIVLKACAYAPEDRYASAQDMLEQLQSLGRGSYETLSVGQSRQEEKPEEFTAVLVENVRPQINTAAAEATQGEFTAVLKEPDIQPEEFTAVLKEPDIQPEEFTAVLKEPDIQPEEFTVVLAEDDIKLEDFTALLTEDDVELAAGFSARPASVEQIIDEVRREDRYAKMMPEEPAYPQEKSGDSQDSLREYENSLTYRDSRGVIRNTVSIVACVLLLVALIYMITSCSREQRQQSYLSWSEWCDECPNNVNANQFYIEQRQLYSSRTLEKKISAQQEDDGQWELYYIESAEGQWSDWSQEPVQASDTREVETVTQYRFRDKQVITSESAQMEGWILYETGTEPGDFGPWTDWSTVPASASDNCRVETKTQYRYRSITPSHSYSGWSSWSSWGDNAVSENDLTDVETRTGYHYYYFVCQKCGKRLPGSNVCYKWDGGCGGSNTGAGYTKLRLATPYGQTKDFGGCGMNYLVVDGQKVFAYVKTSSEHYRAPITQYRYRTRTVSTTNIYGNWSSWSDTAYTQNSSRQVENRTVYRYCVRGEQGVYQFYRWGEWLEWSQIKPMTMDNREIEEQQLYRYRDLGTQQYHYRRWTQWTEYSEEYVKPTDETEVRSKTQYRYKRK